MLTQEQEIDLIDDLEDNLCTSTLASIARCLTIEKHVLQAELDRLKAELTNLANTGRTPLDGTWAGGWASAMSHIMEIVDNWTPEKAGDNK